MKVLLGALLIAVGGCGVRYALDKASVTMPNLHLTEVVVSPKATRVTCEYLPDQTRLVGVHPPGHEGAFSIQTLDRSRAYRLTGVEGIAILPERTTVEEGQTLKFRLTFEPIPDDLWEFHVGEGRYDAEAGETSWQFVKVSLRSP
ncbi:MAG: hypothetical protein ACYTEZ_07350 [Planctomycetota bacterium]|jgi:hypothetical protein